MRKVIILSMAAILTGAGAAAADDFSPPPWDRSSPYAMTAEWEFAQNLNPISPDGDNGITNLVNGGGHITQATMSTSIDGEIIWQPGDGDGEWVFTGDGLIQIEMDGMIDSMAYRDIWIQITYRNPNQILVPPFVKSITAFDSEVGSSVTATYLGEELFAGHHAEMWRLSPSPDWQTINIGVPHTIAVDQIVVDTISVPEPTGVLLLGLGAVFLRRRR